MEKYLGRSRPKSTAVGRERKKAHAKNVNAMYLLEEPSEPRTAKSLRQIRHRLAIFATLFGE
jgi:hypothetical protein